MNAYTTLENRYFACKWEESKWHIKLKPEHKGHEFFDEYLPPVDYGTLRHLLDVITLAYMAK